MNTDSGNKILSITNTFVKFFIVSYEIIYGMVFACLDEGWLYKWSWVVKNRKNITLMNFPLLRQSNLILIIFCELIRNIN